MRTPGKGVDYVGDRPLDVPQIRFVYTGRRGAAPYNDMGRVSRPLAPSVRGLAAEQADWGSVVFKVGHSLRQKSEIFATSLFEGGKRISSFTGFKSADTAGAVSLHSPLTFFRKYCTIVLVR